MMEQLFSSESQIVNIILIAIGLLLLMSFAIVLFFYFSRKKIIKTQLEKAELEIEYQKELLQNTIVTQEEERKRIADSEKRRRQYETYYQDKGPELEDIST